MITDRCPACGAATAPNAQWCSLCYADLRVPATVPITEALTVGAGTTAPRAESTWSTGVVDEVPPEPAHLPRPRGTSWPCHLCGEPRGIDEPECPTCGAGLLPTEPSPALTLPGMGTVETNGQRAIVMIAGAFVITVLLVAVMFIGGAFL